MVSATCHIYEKLIYGFLNIKTENFRGKLQILFCFVFLFFAKMLSLTPLSVLLFFSGRL